MRLVIQSCELLLKEETDQKKISKLTMIQNAATNLHCSINDTIDFVNIKHSQFVSERQIAKIDDVIISVIQIHKLQAEANKV